LTRVLSNPWKMQRIVHERSRPSCKLTNSIPNGRESSGGGPAECPMGDLPAHIDSATTDHPPVPLDQNKFQIPFCASTQLRHNTPRRCHLRAGNPLPGWSMNRAQTAFFVA